MQKMNAKRQSNGKAIEGPNRVFLLTLLLSISVLVLPVFFMIVWPRMGVNGKLWAKLFLSTRKIECCPLINWLGLYWHKPEVNPRIQAWRCGWMLEMRMTGAWGITILSKDYLGISHHGISRNSFQQQLKVDVMRPAEQSPNSTLSGYATCQKSLPPQRNLFPSSQANQEGD